MNYQRRIIILCLSLILVLGFIITGATACNTFELVIENQTDQVLTIYCGGPSLGDAGPGKNITMPADRLMGDYIVFAQNTQGELVFAQMFNFETLQKVESDVWKAVIPPDTPHQGSTFVDLIIENKTDMVLTISVDNEELGDINPGETATKENMPFEQYQSGYRIIAKNVQEQGIFDERLYVYDLQIIDLRTWKAVIE